mmetsp:Transcript_14241/g.24409  ORF Transcript_14241/g.24409 Transcript_14241/m.24409 type:complete len:90 (+) Transcript_14241:68-337(+)
MAAKFYICMLLVTLVSSAVYSAWLRRPQDKETTSNFLYQRIFQDTYLAMCCQISCNHCPTMGYHPCPSPAVCHQFGGGCMIGNMCCCIS